MQTDSLVLATVLRYEAPSSSGTSTAFASDSCAAEQLGQGSANIGNILGRVSWNALVSFTGYHQFGEEVGRYVTDFRK
jgi:hypothetical protein